MPFVTAPLAKCTSPTRSKPGSRQSSPVADRKHVYRKEFDGASGNTTIAVSVKTKSGKDSNKRRSVSASRPSTTSKVQNGDIQKKSVSPQRDSGHKPDSHAEACEFARERLQNLGKPSTDSKHLTWHQRLQEQTLRGRSSVTQPLFYKQDPMCHHTAPHNYHNHCYGCLPPKSKTSQFIDRVSNYVNEGQTTPNFNFLQRGSSRTKSSTVSSQHTNLSCHPSELDDVLYANQGVQCKLHSSTTVKTRSTQPSSTEVCQDTDELEAHDTRIFPSYYHPITSIVFQCKELKRQLDKSSICYKIVSGIEYNLGRLSSEDFERGFSENPEALLVDIESQTNIAQQAEKIKELKSLCKALKQEKRSLEEELKVKLEEISALKSKEDEHRQLSEAYKSKWEDSLKRIDEFSRALTSSAQLVHELQDETKVIPILRSMQTKLNERIDSMLKENELAKLEVQKLKLERETMKAVMQNKDIQLKKWSGVMIEIERFVSDQMNKIASMNHQQKVSQFLTIIDHLHQNNTELESLATTSQESTRNVPRNGNVIDLEQLLDGRGESAMFPRCSSPSSENLSLGPTPSWKQISPIATTRHPSERRDREPPQTHGSSPPPDLMHGSGEGRSWLEQGPYDPTVEAAALNRLPSPSRVEQSSVPEVMLQESQGVRHVPEQGRWGQQNGGDAIVAWLSQQPTLPKPTHTIIDLMPPPSELSHWTDSFDDLEVLSNT